MKGFNKAVEHYQGHWRDIGVGIGVGDWGQGIGVSP
jgi:hypothetical protein